MSSSPPSGPALFGIIFLAIGTARGAVSPAQVDKLALTRESAIEMALRRNIDLKVEILGSSLAETDAARSRGIYDSVLVVIPHPPFHFGGIPASKQ